MTNDGSTNEIRRVQKINTDSLLSLLFTLHHYPPEETGKPNDNILFTAFILLSSY